jgi:hypothetical protein
LAPALQRFPEACFRKGEAVVRGNIEEVDPFIDGQVDRPHSFRGIGLAEDISQRRSSKSQDGNFKIGFSQLPASHDAGKPQFGRKASPMGRTDRIAALMKKQHSGVSE